MTPEQSIRDSRRWLIAAVVALAIRVALDLVGIDLFRLPLEALSTICLLVSGQRSGWAQGYRARTKGDDRMSRGQPPMHPVQIREYIVSVLEDWETDAEVVPTARYVGLAESLAESWLKDRQRAIAEAKDVPF